MKLNRELFNKILLETENSDKATIKTLSIDETSEEVWYHFQLLHDAGYITTHGHKSSSMPLFLPLWV